jgi:Cytosolic carboxypeptidase N-terminal domain
MESVIYEHSKYIRGLDGNDYTYLISTHQQHIPFTQYIKKEHTLNGLIMLPISNQLYFDSKFESGNLQRVIRGSNDTYHLTLQQDDSEKKDKQWYYFAVMNTSKGTLII